MRIAVVGAGPAGLYFAYLWKTRNPESQVDLFEQNAAGATWGFGVVFSDEALDFLRADDPATADAIAPLMESWENISLNLRGEMVEIDGVGFSSIGRLELLKIPFAFVTGYRGDHVNAAFANWPRLPKPCSSEALLSVLQRFAKR